jgi:2-pyrone-4,6-dicarboxylate lactonase
VNDGGANAAPARAPPKPPTKAPRAPLPAGTCDAHFHLFGDRMRFPLDARRNYTPHAATLADYRTVMHACRIERAVLVQPSVCGNDNRCLLDALRGVASDGDAFRGIVVPDAAASDDKLLAMDALGVRGIRLNVVNPQMLGTDDALALCARKQGRGWHLQVHLSLAGEGAATLARLAERSAMPIVVDHFGRPAADEALPPLLLDLVASGRVRSSSRRRTGSARRLPTPRARRSSTRSSPPIRRAGLARRLAAHRAARRGAYDADLVDQLVSWLPDPALLQRVCVDNPAELDGF